ncbi:MAG: DUF1214 domain-containing protein [Rhodobacteraceae bacterium]|nr:DUF1214 domain-containing protein [Paracoccaceae bacterium]
MGRATGHHGPGDRRRRRDERWRNAPCGDRQGRAGGRLLVDHRLRCRRLPRANDLGRNSYNNTSARPNADGSYTIHFGGCEDGRINCIPVTPGWNYTIRLYQPRAEILDGSWTFPAFEPAG